ncbi:hypothetical protein C8F01DRAFT_549447 [Mycena amicta]|nr:hypothetical protein C8F01DRAFT_549447 [Mycena amicta]
MFSCIYSTSPGSASAAGVPCSPSALFVTSLDMPGAWKSSYNGPSLKSSSSTTAWPSSSFYASTRSATIVLGVATATSIASDSSISASAPSFRAVASPEPVSQCNTATSSATRLQVSSVSTILDRDTLVAQAEATTPSPSPSMAKAGIYGPRRGPTSRSTSSATIVVVAATFESESVINVSATSSVAAAVPEPVSEHDIVTSSNLHSHIQSTVSILNRDRPVAEVEANTTSPPLSISQAGIYSRRRGPTSPSTSPATSVLVAATSGSESVINASATSLFAAAVSEPVSEPDTYTSSDSPMHLQSTAACVSDRDTHVAHAEATSNSPPPPIAKAGIYGGRRGPTSPSTSTQSSSTSTDAATAPMPPPLAPRAVSREKHMRVAVPSIRRHRATSTKRVGRDMTFGGMIPRGRQSSGLRIIVLVRTGLLADQRAKKLLEERAKEKERIEKEERMVGGEMLDMAREERMEMMARKVKEVKRRRKGMDMDAVPGKKPKKIQIQGWQAGSETDWVIV